MSIDGALSRDTTGMQPRRYELRHVTEYTYDDSVSTSFGRAHLVPSDGDGQRCLASELDIDPAPTDRSDHTDYFGNVSTYFCVRHPHTSLRVSARSVVEVDRSPARLDDLGSVTWEEVREDLDTRPELAEFVLPSPRLGPAAEVSAYARTVFTPGLPVGEAIMALVHRIHGDFTYKSGSTTVRTTLPQLLEQRKGVCQDFAHLAIGAMRSVGLAARYVSGYLETQPPPGKPKLQGADASHAWASIFVPGTGWLDLDPTNNQLVDNRYLVVARGRDYSDVTPIKGVIVTDSKKSTMKVAVDVIRLD